MKEKTKINLPFEKEHRHNKGKQEFARQIPASEYRQKRVLSYIYLYGIMIGSLVFLLSLGWWMVFIWGAMWALLTFVLMVNENSISRQYGNDDVFDFESEEAYWMIFFFFVSWGVYLSINEYHFIKTKREIIYRYFYNENTSAFDGDEVPAFTSAVVDFLHLYTAPWKEMSITEAQILEDANADEDKYYGEEGEFLDVPDTELELPPIKTTKEIIFANNNKQTN